MPTQRAAWASLFGYFLLSPVWWQEAQPAQPAQLPPQEPPFFFPLTRAKTSPPTMSSVIITQITLTRIIYTCFFWF